MTDKPFIPWIGHGAASLAQPAVFSDAKGWVFLIDADRKAIQTLADTLLNPAGKGVVKYDALLPVAMLSFLDIKKSTSVTDTLGWLPGRECAIWVPLIEHRPGSLFGARLVFWSPYIFINYAIGMITGRDVWGWPKSLARISVPGDTQGNPEFFCTTTIFRRFDPARQGEDAMLYRVVQTQPAPEPPPLWRTKAEVTAGLARNLLGGVTSDLLHALQWQPAIPCVQLKQLRSAADPTKACFQAIVESPVALTNLTGGGLLTGQYSVEVTTCDSHRIVSDLLGRAPNASKTTLPVRIGAWVSGDFTALRGRDIVVNT
ncbi:MAG TPA: hypothetical protein VFG62_02655 [Rhodopila sp.]|jgi:hypothetical protein|nr:hypothetical protein [Rhodopila sp.]